MVNLCFDLYWKDEKVGRVEIVNNVLVKNEVYTSDFYKQPYARIKNAMDMVSALHERVMCPERWEKFQLEAIGLKEYDFYKILRAYRGICYDDFFWLRFDGDTVSYRDIKIRE